LTDDTNIFDSGFECAMPIGCPQNFSLPPASKRVR